MALMILMLLITTIHCGKGASKESEKKKEEEGIPVEIARVSKGSVTAHYSATATLEAEGEAVVVAKIGDVIKHIFFEEGDRVKTGQILAKLDDERYKLEVRQARSRLEKLTNDLKRNEELHQQNIISKEEFERIKFDHRTQLAIVDLAKLRLNYTSIRAPIDGIVSERMIKVGNMVQVNQSTFRITDFEPLWAVLHIPEKEIAKLKVNYPATLKVDALPDLEFKGSILRVSPVVSAQTGTIKVTVMVSDPSGNLKAGMFVRVNIIYDTHQNTLLVPKNAVIVEDQESYVFVVAEGKAIKKTVKTGYINTTHMEILTGLEINDQVVITGFRSLKDSNKVQVVNQ